MRKGRAYIDDLSKIDTTPDEDRTPAKAGSANKKNGRSTSASALRSFLRHISLAEPIEIRIDGRIGKGVILKG